MELSQSNEEVQYLSSKKKSVRQKVTAMEDLKESILKWNEAYRSGEALVSDQEFDAACEKLQSQMDEVEWAKFRSKLFEKAGKVKHPYPMGSLAKFKYEEPATVCAWINEHVPTALNVSAKVDGISCRLHYSEGKLCSATTRGDGLKGENITEKIFAGIKEVPKQIQEKGEVDIRGELVILDEDFEGLDFANPRNATAGIIGRKEVSEDLKKISFVAYTVFGDKFTKKQQFEVLEKNGFFVAWHKSFSVAELQVKTAKGFEKFNEELRSYVKQSLPYGTDGLVLSDDSYRNEPVLIPESQVAFKVNESAAETQILDISWTGPSKDGKFVPVAILDPVEIAGTIVSKVSLYNLDFLTKNRLVPGTKVKVVKSGEIIPKIVEVRGEKI